MTHHPPEKKARELIQVIGVTEAHAHVREIVKNSDPKTVYGTFWREVLDYLNGRVEQ